MNKRTEGLSFRNRPYSRRAVFRCCERILKMLPKTTFLFMHLSTHGRCNLKFGHQSSVLCVRLGRISGRIFRHSCFSPLQKLKVKHQSEKHPNIASWRVLEQLCKHSWKVKGVSCALTYFRSNVEMCTVQCM